MRWTNSDDESAECRCISDKPVPAYLIVLEKGRVSEVVVVHCCCLMVYTVCNWLLLIDCSSVTHSHTDDGLVCYSRQCW